MCVISLPGLRVLMPTSLQSAFLCLPCAENLLFLEGPALRPSSLSQVSRTTSPPMVSPGCFLGDSRQAMATFLCVIASCISLDRLGALQQDLCFLHSCFLQVEMFWGSLCLFRASERMAQREDRWVSAHPLRGYL